MSIDLIIPVERLNACGKECFGDSGCCGDVGICKCHALENLKKPDLSVDKSAPKPDGGIF